MTTARSQRETFTVKSGEVVDRVKQLIHEGNVRRIIVTHEGHTIVEIPLTVGVIGVVFAPMLAAVAAVAALLTECTIEVEREDQAPPGG